jgi:hypothetical protein
MGSVFKEGVIKPIYQSRLSLIILNINPGINPRMGRGIRHAANYAAFFNKICGIGINY